MKMLQKFLLVAALVTSCVTGANAETFKGHVDARIGNGTWSYRVFNNERSPYSIQAFTLSVNAPFTVVSTPHGWTYEIRGNTVRWMSRSRGAYGSDIQPGEALAGFVIESDAPYSDDAYYEIRLWDLDIDRPAQAVRSAILVPSDYILGDLNEDGRVNARDVELSRQIARKKIRPTRFQREAGDVNNDGRLNAKDTALIQKRARERR